MKMLSNMKIFSLFTLLVVAILFSASFTSAKVEKVEESFCGNEGFNCECQNFYSDMDYYAIEKWAPTGDEDYAVDETNSMYSYYNFDVTGDLKSADWTSNYRVYSVLVKAGNNRVEFSGGTSGSVNSTKDISHITFCGHRTNDGGCIGSDCEGNGVPEFSPLTVAAAMLVVTLGLVFIRKN